MPATESKGSADGPATGKKRKAAEAEVEAEDENDEAAAAGAGDDDDDDEEEVQKTKKKTTKAAKPVKEKKGKPYFDVSKVYDFLNLPSEASPVLDEEYDDEDFSDF